MPNAGITCFTRARLFTSDSGIFPNSSENFQALLGSVLRSAQSAGCTAATLRLMLEANMRRSKGENIRLPMLSPPSPASFWCSSR